MQLSDIRFLAPEFSLLAFALVVILLDLFIKRKGVLAGISVAGVVVSAGFTVALWGTPGIAIFGRMLAVDNFALFFKLLMLTAAGLVILASQDYVNKFERFQGEYYALVLISAVGMMLLASATDLISIYISLELTGIPLYVLATFLKDRKSSEAGLKYLLLGAVASAILLYGMALIFGFTGRTCLMCIAEYVQGMPGAGLLSHPALLLAMVMLAAGFGFKIASFPFQMWVPDVYEGAPTPVTAYLSVASKAAGSVPTGDLCSPF
jgi:NADH-quinone oxidoreductase subunit N